MGPTGQVGDPGERVRDGLALSLLGLSVCLSTLWPASSHVWMAAGTSASVSTPPGPVTSHASSLLGLCGCLGSCTPSWP